MRGKCLDSRIEFGGVQPSQAAITAIHLFRRKKKEKNQLTMVTILFLRMITAVIFNLLSYYLPITFLGLNVINSTT